MPMRFVSDDVLAGFIAEYQPGSDLSDMLIELQARRKHAGSGCACDIVEDDDGSESIKQNGQRVREWCDLHAWYMKHPTPETRTVTSTQCLHRWTVLGAPRDPYPDELCEGGCGKTYAEVQSALNRGVDQ